MTAYWTSLSYDVPACISTRITNSVVEVNRVVLDVMSKPPATIEWEQNFVLVNKMCGSGSALVSAPGCVRSASIVGTRRAL